MRVEKRKGKPKERGKSRRRGRKGV